ncbi:glucose-6-phosphate dehydrogenase, partial [Bacillus sp. S34]|nr:glucose-6-phosphate dehydrogenase [Bacillus sp. S34]
SCAVLKGIDLPAGTRLALEKPFGTDAASAEALNDLLHSFLPEERIHRVDHFLGRSTVLNLLGLRFANRIVEPLLS